MASTPGFSPGVNAAHEVSPMKGGIFYHPSISTFTSSRGKDTFTTFSFVSGLPPVAEATRFASTGGLGACGAALAGGGVEVVSAPAAVVAAAGTGATLVVGASADGVDG
jgi:hypothetical protein